MTRTGPLLQARPQDSALWVSLLSRLPMASGTPDPTPEHRSLPQALRDPAAQKPLIIPALAPMWPKEGLEGRERALGLRTAACETSPNILGSHHSLLDTPPGQPSVCVPRPPTLFPGQLRLMRVQ